MSRTLSFSEVSTALDCEARWDFSYGNVLAGTSLKSKRVLPILSGGKAWGAMVATWHQRSGSLFAYSEAIEAMMLALAEDAERQRSFGVHDQAQHDELVQNLRAIFDHYIVTAGAVPMPLDRLEEEIDVAIPSRGGKRASTLYRFLGYFDGVTEDEGRNVLVEFKLRKRLTSVELIANSRQIRWYAWAWQRKFGIPVDGVWVEERLNEHPKPARLVRPKKKGQGFVLPQLTGHEDPVVASHAVDQVTTSELYIEACQLTSVEPLQEVVETLDRRRWSQRVPVWFRPGELEEAGHELVSAALKIRDLDNGSRYPLRNVKPQLCNGCRFNEICPDPEPRTVEALFERVAPKRDRIPEEQEARA